MWEKNSIWNVDKIRILFKINKKILWIKSRIVKFYFRQKITNNDNVY